jgi:hypothetical protein
MHKAIMAGRRVTLGLAVTAAAVLGAGAAPAQATEGPVYQEIKIAYSAFQRTSQICGRSEVWGVAAGKDSPESKRGNYQVCGYATSYVDTAWLGLVDQELKDRAVALVHKTAGTPPTGEMLSYCRYNMPTGPNRSATVRYNELQYNLTVIDHFPNGQSFVSVTGMGFSGSMPAVSWSPSCNTL